MVDALRGAMSAALVLALPLLAVGLLVGLISGLIQSLANVQDAADHGGGGSVAPNNSREITLAKTVRRTP